jgi:hypothetical protein
MLLEKSLIQQRQQHLNHQNGIPQIDQGYNKQYIFGVAVCMWHNTQQIREATYA